MKRRNEYFKIWIKQKFGIITPSFHCLYKPITLREVIKGVTDEEIQRKNDMVKSLHTQIKSVNNVFEELRVSLDN